MSNEKLLGLLDVLLKSSNDVISDVKGMDKDLVNASTATQLAWTVGHSDGIKLCINVIKQHVDMHGDK